MAVFIIRKVKRFIKSFSICLKPNWFFWLIQSLLTLHITIYGKPLCTSCLCSWAADHTLKKYTYNSIQKQAFVDVCMDNQVCKLFALARGTVTWGHVSNSFGKSKVEILSNLESNKNKYYLKKNCYLFDLNS